MIDPKSIDILPGKAPINLEFGDTLDVVFTLTDDQNPALPLNLIGCVVELIISLQKHGTPLCILLFGSGIDTMSDLANGEIKVFWRSDILVPSKSYWYRLRITFPNGLRRSFVEDQINPG